MPVTVESLAKLPLAFASCSIGCKPEHTLAKKLDAISSAGFKAIELSMPDLVSYANEHNAQSDGAGVGSDDYDRLCNAARGVRDLCASKGLMIMMLQPFANFEGWPEQSTERQEAWTRAEGWMRIMEAAGTDMLQVGSSDSPEAKIGNDRARFVDDLRTLADMLAQRNFRLAYENWCWSTHAPHWEDVWEICKQVDRPNFGLCLDTFQSAGGEWADPTTPSGMIEDGRSAAQVEKDWRSSCAKLSRTVPAEKIFLLQISDAYKPEQPFDKAEIEGLRPRGRWSHDFRPLPFQGYLPTVDFTKAVLDTGFRGWFSYEIFDGGPDGKGKQYDLEPFAKAAMTCQRRLVEECASSER